MRHLQRQERCGGRQDFARPCGENTSKFKTRKQIHNIQSGLGSILNEEDIPICIKYMLVFSWVINFEVNWRSLNSKDSWGHWQHVWLIMTHESTLTLVIAGSWWAGHSTWEFEGKWFPLPHSSLLSPPSVGKTTRESFFLLAIHLSLSIFYISHLPEHPAIFHFSIQYSGDFLCVDKQYGGECFSSS